MGCLSVAKGIVLAGGMGTRLAPCTTVTNKHLLPVGPVPMIFHPLNLLKKLGILDIMVIVGGESVGEFLELLGSGEKYGLNLSFRVQDRPNGIAGAILLSEAFADNDDIVVILGDNIFDPEYFTEDVIALSSQVEAKLFLKEVPDPKRFGVAEIKNDRIVSIVEKPQIPPSNLAVAGLYVYSSTSGVFDVLRGLRPSKRNELEITDVNNYYVDKGCCTYHIVDSYWSDAGTWPSYCNANIWAFANIDKIKLNRGK